MVKCARCGFLTIRDKRTGSLMEASRAFRLLGEFEFGHQRRGLDIVPYCFVLAYDLHLEWEEDPAGYRIEPLEPGEQLCPYKPWHHRQWLTTILDQKQDVVIAEPFFQGLEAFAGCPRLDFGDQGGLLDTERVDVDIT